MEWWINWSIIQIKYHLAFQYCRSLPLTDNKIPYLFICLFIHLFEKNLHPLFYDQSSFWRHFLLRNDCTIKCLSLVSTQAWFLSLQVGVGIWVWPSYSEAVLGMFTRGSYCQQCYGIQFNWSCKPHLWSCACVCYLSTVVATNSLVTEVHKSHPKLSTFRPSV